MQKYIFYPISVKPRLTMQKKQPPKGSCQPVIKVVDNIVILNALRYKWPLYAILKVLNRYNYKICL